MLTPEQQARLRIDNQLVLCGWSVQSYSNFNPSTNLGIAVTEYPTESGSADYILFVDRKPVGVIEAKKEGHTLSQVHEQTIRYATDEIKYFIRKDELPFQFESTGSETFFTDSRDPSPRQREIFAFHRPETLYDWFKQPNSLRTRLQQFPELNRERLRECQIKAVSKLETSFAKNHPRALVQMATGAGKTYAAITSVYRLLKYAKAKRILFLVDTRNLGKQTEQEFQAYKPNDDKRLFTELYNLQRLQSNYIDPTAQVCISTIQRMYSILKGKDLDESLEDESPYETKSLEKPVEVTYNPKVPIETFDFIIIDECHRSIYNLWKQVLDYFDAFMIGLTATPDSRTFAFFNENVVSEYTLKQSIIDKVNVDYEVYTIETEVTEQGGQIKAKQYVDLRNKMTRKKEWKQLDDEVKYEPFQLDKDVVNPSQIRKIIKEYKRVLEADFFPERQAKDDVPKTLIFAKTDSHAEDIVHIVREEFGEGNDFCKKITYNVKNEDPDSIIQQFRTAYYPRIAVTVDMIAAGTDIKPIEVLIFMRDVRSRNYFQQMIGRGTRSFSKEELIKVTPNAKLNKEHFYIIDAVNVFKSIKVDYPVIDRKPAISLKDLMKMVILQPDDENISSLAARLTKIDKQISDADRDKFMEYNGGLSITDTINNLVKVTEPDVQYVNAKQKYNLSDDDEPTEAQIKTSMESLINEAIKPFDNPELRTFLETVRQKIYQIIDTVNIDRVLFSGFDSRAKESAEEVINNFKEFIKKNKSEIIALNIIYNQPYRRKELNLKMINELKEALASPPYALTAENIWNAYHRLEPQKVTGLTVVRILTDIISLIRYEIGIDKELRPYNDIVNINFKNWIFRRQAVGKIFTEEQLDWLRMIRDHVITSVRMEKDDFDYTPFVDNGGLGKFYKLFGEETEEIINRLNEELVT